MACLAAVRRAVRRRQEYRTVGRAVPECVGSHTAPEAGSLRQITDHLLNPSGPSRYLEEEMEPPPKFELGTSSYHGGGLPRTPQRTRFELRRTALLQIL